eukprot:TRINITY_DN11296_c0_g1_i1.p1 TRINITY_DN11296_c0_g1~~TRINITY_DN11296_c0_g1_i1.p1  ORF type:complete len:304 (+),score=71.31 TRINITY_DN11296_c0_g1_i1:558-1469(+)
MLARGYDGKFHAKSRVRTMDEQSSRSVDGCVIFWKHHMFDCVSQESIEYQSLALKKYEMIGQAGMYRLMTKDNIALVVILRPLGPLVINASAKEDKLVVVNTHLHWDPSFCDVKAMQVQMLLEKLEDIKSNYSCPSGASLPMIISGDFNSVPSSAAYHLLDTGSVKGNHVDFAQHDYGTYTRNGLQHKLDLRSSYKEVMGREPSFTNYTGDFMGTLDYIWYTDCTLSAERVVSPQTEELVLSHNGALPNPYMCSDHIPLVTDFFGKLVTRSSSYRVTTQEEVGDEKKGGTKNSRKKRFGLLRL